MKETKAAAGYNGTEEVFELVVDGKWDNEAETSKLTVINSCMPQTGDIDHIFSFGLLGAASVFALYQIP